MNELFAQPQLVWFKLQLGDVLLVNAYQYSHYSAKFFALYNLTRGKLTQQIPSCFHVDQTKEISFYSENSRLVLLSICCKSGVILLKSLG